MKKKITFFLIALFIICYQARAQININSLKIVCSKISSYKNKETTLGVLEASCNGYSNHVFFTSSKESFVESIKSLKTGAKFIVLIDSDYSTFPDDTILIEGADFTIENLIPLFDN